ncbi:MAG: hypothetical protein AAF745_19225 [Planctomycetota bacterium]
MNRIHTLASARREPSARAGAVTSAIWATMAGTLVPLLILIVGLISKLLESGGLSDPAARLGSSLSVALPDRFIAQEPLVQLIQLTVLGFVVAVVFCFAVWRHRRMADYRASAVVKALHTRVLKQSVRRAETEGAAPSRSMPKN